VILTTDGRGEFILVSEGRNVYEEFATSANAFATVSSTDPEETGYQDFNLAYTYDDVMESWPEGWERRVLVKSNHVYGANRRIQDLKFDVKNAYGPLVTVFPNDETCDIRIRVRAITTEFDPETVTWQWAYTESNLGRSETYADYLLTTGSATVEAAGLPSRRNTPLAAWNELKAIHGFELRVEPNGGEREWLQALWQATISWPYPPVGYVILA